MFRGLATTGRFDRMVHIGVGNFCSALVDEPLMATKKSLLAIAGSAGGAKTFSF